MSKFKVGDKCKVINFINTLGEDKKHHTIGSIITIESVDEDYNDPLFLYSCSDGTHRGNDELELLNPKTTKFVYGCSQLPDFSNVKPGTTIPFKHTPLTNTIITDIKDEEQHKRVQKKLFSMGCKWYESYGEGTEVITSYSKQILISKYSTMHNGCYNRLHKHITANEFLQEVEPLTINPDYLKGCDFGVDIKPGTIIQKSRQIGNRLYEQYTSPMMIGDYKIEKEYTPNFGKSLASALKDINNYTFPSKENKTNNKPMDNIVSFFNDLTVSGDDKELRKAGLKDDALRFTSDALLILKNLEAKELGFKNYEEMFAKTNSDSTLALSVFEANTLFTKFYTKLLDTAKKFNRKDEKKAAKK